MKATITASENFMEFIKLHESQIVLIKTKEVENDGSYNASLSSTASQYIISFIIGVSSSYVSTLLKEYIEKAQEPIEVKIKTNKYNLTPQNVEEKIPQIHAQFVALLNEEKND